VRLPIAAPDHSCDGRRRARGLYLRGGGSRMTGLKELTVQGAKSLADAHARHRWDIPSDYNVAIDCLDRPFHRADAVALYYEDDEGKTAKYTFGQMRDASNRFANALKSLGVGRGDVVAVHTPQRPETAIIHMALY